MGVTADGKCDKHLLPVDSSGYCNECRKENPLQVFIINEQGEFIPHDPLKCIASFTYHYNYNFEDAWQQILSPTELTTYFLCDLITQSIIKRLCNEILKLRCEKLVDTTHAYDLNNSPGMR